MASSGGCARQPDGSCTREGSGTHACLSETCRRLVHNLCAQDVVRNLPGSGDGDFFCSELCFCTVRGISSSLLRPCAPVSSAPTQPTVATALELTNPSGLPASASTTIAVGVIDSRIKKPNKKGGKKMSAIKALFEEAKDPLTQAVYGSKCLRCHVLVRDKKLDGSLMSKHIFNKCRQASYDDRLLAWRSCKPLREREPEPQPLLPPRSSPTKAYFPGGLYLVATASTGGKNGALGNSAQCSKPPAPGKQMFLKNFADRLDLGEIERIQQLLINFFVAHDIPFSTVDSPTFKDFVSALRPAFVSGGGLPTRQKLSGVMLDDLYDGVQKKVANLIRMFLAQGGRMTLMLDGWENVNHAHLINFLAIVGSVVVFLDSAMIGAVNQNAENQAKVVQDILDPFGGVKSFAAVVTDNTQSCLNMRELIVQRNPGIVSLNDQSHVSNLLFKDLCAVPYIANAIQSSDDISSFVRGHMYVLALFTMMKNKFNFSLKQETNSATEPAVNFTPASGTRFCYSLDSMERSVKNRKVVRDMVDGKAELESKVSLTTQSARDAMEHFVEIVDERSTWKEMEESIMVLKHVRVYLRLWDVDRVDITTVVSATSRLFFGMKEEVEGLQVRASAPRFSKFVGDSIMFALQRRIYGPVSSTVKVLLLEDIHFLAAVLSPATVQTNFAELVPRALHAFSHFLVNSPEIFSAEELQSTTEEERVSQFRSQLLVFIAGTIPSLLMGRDSCRNFSTPEEFAGFWILYGNDVPILQKCGVWISYLSASSCPAERSFSAQSNTHSKKRNRLMSERVKKLVYCRWNLRLFSSMSPALQDAIDELFELDGALKEMLDECDEVEELDVTES